MSPRPAEAESDPLLDFWRTTADIARRRVTVQAVDPDDPYDWRRRARPEQLAPEWEWFLWLLKPGRGWGKTRTAAETIREDIFGERQARLGALVGANPRSVRKTMVEGPSGILAVCRPEEKPLWEPSKHQLTFPNGAILHTYAATQPEELRGPEHDTGWADEVDAWHYAGPESSPIKAQAAFDNFLLGLRRSTPAGRRARGVATSTPKKARIVAGILKRAALTGDTHVTGGHTRENLANLDPAWYESLLRRYEGTALERQELAGILDESAEGALWHQSGWKTPDGRAFPGIDDLRKRLTDPLPEAVRAAVAIDPAGAWKSRSAETGIIAGILGEDGHGYLLKDRSGRVPPEVWGMRAVDLYDALQADAILGETNYGGDMVRSTVHAVRQDVNFIPVNSRRGKYIRAEPIAALAAQGLIHHVGEFQRLESQLVQMTDAGYEGGMSEDESPSPDRLDAYVHLFTHLMLQAHGGYVG